MSSSECSACHRQIVYLRTETGKKMPCEPTAQVLRALLEDEPWQKGLHETHWAHCSAPDLFRRKPKA